MCLGFLKGPIPLTPPTSTPCSRAAHIAHAAQRAERRAGASGASTWSRRCVPRRRRRRARARRAFEEDVLVVCVDAVQEVPLDDGPVLQGGVPEPSLHLVPRCVEISSYGAPAIISNAFIIINNDLCNVHVFSLACCVTM